MKKTILLILLYTAIAAGQSAPPGLPKGVGLEQKLDATVPLDARFRDEQGNAVSLQSLFHGRPVILTLNYYRCPMLCTMTLNGISAAFFSCGRC